MRRAFGWPETLLFLVWVSLTTWGVGSTMIRRAETPPWMRQVAGVWT